MRKRKYEKFQIEPLKNENKNITLQGHHRSLSNCKSGIDIS